MKRLKEPYRLARISKIAGLLLTKAIKLLEHSQCTVEPYARQIYINKKTLQFCFLTKVKDIYNSQIFSSKRLNNKSQKYYQLLYVTLSNKSNYSNRKFTVFLVNL